MSSKKPKPAAIVIQATPTQTQQAQAPATQAAATTPITQPTTQPVTQPTTQPTTQAPVNPLPDPDNPLLEAQRKKKAPSGTDQSNAVTTDSSILAGAAGGSGVVGQGGADQRLGG